MKKRINMLTFLYFLAAVSFVAPAGALTIRVPEDVASIQEALDSASGGDVVDVALGIHSVDTVRFPGVPVTLRGRGGSAATVLKGSGTGPVIIFENGEGRDTVLEGFTIEGGGGEIACAVLVATSSPTLSSCRITSARGFPLFAVDASPHIVDCTVDGNEESGLLFWFCSPVIRRCTITGNTAENRGGGIWAHNSSLFISGCTIKGNAAHYGGGIYAETTAESDPVEVRITDSGIEENTAELGGGLYLADKSVSGEAKLSLSVSGCRVTGNLAASTDLLSGGGALLEGLDSPTFSETWISENRGTYGAGLCAGGVTELTLVNCVVSANTGWAGAGIFSLLTSSVLKHCTVTGNAADSTGGGVLLEAMDHVIINSIVWGNAAPAAPEIAAGTGNLHVSYSNLGPAGEEPWAGPGNLNLDPLFGGPGVVHLAENSPLRDRGTDAGVTTDIDGHLRPLDGGFDIGADEYWAKPRNCSALPGPAAGTRTRLCHVLLYLLPATLILWVNKRLARESAQGEQP